jgi:hypothetical protein
MSEIGDAIHEKCLSFGDRLLNWMIISWKKSVRKKMTDARSKRVAEFQYI